MAEKIMISDHVEFIRGEIRDELNENRKQKRHINLNKTRMTLGEVTENEALTEEFVTNAALSLKKKSLNIQDYSKLQNALIQSENHVNAFFNQNSAITGLVRDLSSTSTSSKLAAANCCCNLSLGNSKACNKLCKFAAPYLVALLESTNKPLVEVCAWTIGNLVCGSDDAFHILHAQNCLKSLINLALQSSDAILPAASYAILRYIYTGYNIIRSEEILELGEIIKRYPSVSDVDTIWLIAMLSSKVEFLEVLKNCAPAFCDYLKEALLKEDEPIEKVSAALRIICNVISEPLGQVAHYLFKDEIKNNIIFLEKLLSHQYMHIRHETLWLIGNLFNHSLESVQLIIKPFILNSQYLKLVVNSLNAT